MTFTEANHAAVRENRPFSRVGGQPVTSRLTTPDELVALSKRSVLEQNGKLYEPSAEDLAATDWTVD